MRISLCSAIFGGGRWHPPLGRSGTVAVLFAASVLPLMIAIDIGIDMARITDGRSILRQAADNAALSGAASFRVNSAADTTRAVVSATASFCDITATMPTSFVVSTSGASGQQSCGSGAGVGPAVSTQIAGFKSGTPGITPSACSATNPVVAGVTCGFIVTVTATAKMPSLLQAVFGISQTISVTAMAANPFINIGTALTAQILGSARYADTIWVYPLLLNANGQPDFSTNLGAIPNLPSGLYNADASPSGCSGATTCGSIGTPAGVNCTSTPAAAACAGGTPSGCTDNPAQFVCGNFTMLADTYYNTAQNPCPSSAPCYPNGVGSYPEFITGVVQNPQAPPAIITATTPIGIAYESISGGGTTGYPYGGYQANPANGCKYPGNTIYTTVSQLYGNAADSLAAGNAGVDWPKVTHWFYSSYLANGYSPTEGEILSQAQLQSYTPPGGGATIHYNTRIPSLGDNSTGVFNPTLAACAATAGNGNSYDEFLTTTYPSSGATNGALFITQQTPGSAYVPPASTGYAYTLYTPAATPGYQYSDMSCQAYGPNVYTFYWNDMGGNAQYNDDLDYNNGAVRIQCQAASFVVLIQ